MNTFAPFAWADRKDTGIGEVLFDSAQATGAGGVYDPQGVAGVLLHADGAPDGYAILYGIHNDISEWPSTMRQVEFLFGNDRVEMDPFDSGCDPEEGFLCDECVTYGSDDFLDFARDLLAEVG